MSRITPIDIRREVKRLQNAYALPRDADPDGLCEAWSEALEGVRADELHDAVSEYLKNGGRYWPTPAEIRRAALDARRGTPEARNDLRSQYLRWEQSHAGPCPVCRAVLQLVRRERPDGSTVDRYGVIHDPFEHERQRVPHVGLPDRPERRDDEKAAA